jgi:hypothetical protein
MNYRTDIPSYDVRNAFRDPRSSHFQDEIRKAMQATMKPRKPEPHSPLFDTAVPIRTKVREYLAKHGHSSRADIGQATGYASRQVDSALRFMRERDHVSCYRADSVNLYGLTPLGMAVMEDPEPQPTGTPIAVKLRLAPAEEIIESVFDYILMTGACTRMEIVSALNMSESTLENVFRTLRFEGRLITVDSTVGRKHTYDVVKPAGFSHSSKAYWRCAHEGLSMSETARKLKVSVQAVADAAARYDLKFADGRKKN